MQAAVSGAPLLPRCRWVPVALGLAVRSISGWTGPGRSGALGASDGVIGDGRSEERSGRSRNDGESPAGADPGTGRIPAPTRGRVLRSSRIAGSPSDRSPCRDSGTASVIGSAERRESGAARGRSGSGKQSLWVRPRLPPPPQCSPGTCSPVEGSPVEEGARAGGPQAAGLCPVRRSAGRVPMCAGCEGAGGVRRSWGGPAGRGERRAAPCLHAAGWRERRDGGERDFVWGRGGGGGKYGVGREGSPSTPAHSHPLPPQPTSTASVTCVLPPAVLTLCSAAPHSHRSPQCPPGERGRPGAEIHPCQDRGCGLWASPLQSLSSRKRPGPFLDAELRPQALHIPEMGGTFPVPHVFPCPFLSPGCCLRPFLPQHWG